MRNARSFAKIYKAREFPVIFATVLLFVLLAILSENFLSANNVMNVLRYAAIIVVVAVGEALILISGEVDISVGALTGFCGIMAALLWQIGCAPVVILFGTMTAGALVSTISALLITRLRLASFVVTLGMLSVLKGSMLVITGGFQLKYESPLSVLGHGYIGPISVSVLVMFIVFALIFVVLNFTPFGRKILTTGSNKFAAEISGIAVKNIKLACFSITGALCGISGLMMAGSVLSAGATSGVGNETDVLASCIIGGTTLLGGEGSIVGTLLGGILLALMRNGFVLLNIGASWQMMATGGIIVISIIIDSLKNNRNRI